MARWAIRPSSKGERLGQARFAAGEVPDEVDVDIEAVVANALGLSDSGRVRVLGDDGLAPAADRVPADVSLPFVDRDPVGREAVGERGEVLLVGGAGGSG